MNTTTSPTDAAQAAAELILREAERLRGRWSRLETKPSDRKAIAALARSLRTISDATEAIEAAMAATAKE